MKENIPAPDILKRFSQPQTDLFLFFVFLPFDLFFNLSLKI